MTSKIEIHYFFHDNSHTMDAFIRNKCEAEFLAIIKEISSITGISIKAETEAYTEGGLIEKIRLITKNQFLLGIIAGIAINVLSDKLTKDPEIDDLQKKKLKLEITKLERELNESNKNSIIFDSNEAAQVISSSYKIIKHKSNFYKSLTNYNKVTAVSFSGLDLDNQESKSPKVVERKDFDHYILSSDDLPSMVDEQAVIEIISPVLKPGKFKWKGQYTRTGDTIDFFMKDNNFKEEVVKTGIAFRNGSCIDCTLETKRKLTDTGEISISSYSVLEVYRVRDELITFDVPKSKKKKQSLSSDTQISLFS
jgi:hypothetical protein